MGNLEVFKYKLLLYGKACRRLSSNQQDIWTGTLVIPDFAFHSQRHHKFPLAKPVFFHQKIQKLTGHLQFLNVTFGSFNSAAENRPPHGPPSAVHIGVAFRSLRFNPHIPKKTQRGWVEELPLQIPTCCC